MFITVVLRRLGYRVVAVEDGLAALEAWRAGRFDCVILDLQMPRLDGWQAFAAIREQEGPSGRHTPVIALTAHTLASERERILAQGFDAFLPKPVDTFELKARLAEVIPCRSR